MSTVGKAISLLELFSVDETELGLTELARRTNFDKATTRRLLLSLVACGFVEQDEDTRLYRLGAGLTRLARVREAHLPLLGTTLPFLRTLAVETGETVYLAEAGNGVLMTVHVEHPARANRVNVDVGGFLPLHSTASGIAYLAEVHPAVIRSALNSPMEAFTVHTVTEPSAVMAMIEAARRDGYSINSQGYEEGVVSVAAAILGADGYAVGTLAIAAPLDRTPETAIRTRGRAASEAAREISEMLNGDRMAPAAKRA